MRTSPTNDHPASDEPKRDRHGRSRSVPPPPLFDLDTLAGSTLLTEFEVASFLRLSRSTVESWRQQSDHPLRWIALPTNGFVRYYAGALREFLALGRRRKPPVPAAPPTTSKTPAPARKRRARTTAAAAATEPA